MSLAATSVEKPVIYRLRLAAPWLSAAVVLLSALWMWQTQYYVDYEVSLLPWLISRGWIPYRDFVDQHTPLFPVILTLAGAGDPGVPLHLVIVALNLLTLVLVCAVGAHLAGRLWGPAAGIIAAGWLVAFDGSHLWYDGALAPIYLGVLLMTSARPRAGGLIISFSVGVLLGIGVLVKQHAALVVPFLGLVLLLETRDRRWRRLLACAAGLALPVLVTGIWLAYEGALGAALYWVATYTFESNYMAAGAQSPGAGEWFKLAALYAPLLALALTWRRSSPRIAPSILLAGMIVAATLPAWPRYAPYHLQAAVPLLAVAAMIAAGRAAAPLRGPHARRAFAALASLGLVSLGAAVGIVESARLVSFSGQIGSPQPPFGDAQGSMPMLRAWVEAHAPPGSTMFVYDLNSLLYRVLEREPPRTFVPQLPWINSARDTAALWRQGIERARPSTALLPAAEWDANPGAVVGSVDAWLRRNYHEEARFEIRDYKLGLSVTVVGLLRNDGPTP